MNGGSSLVAQQAKGSGIAIAVAWITSVAWVAAVPQFSFLAWELPHAEGVAKTKQKQKTRI